MLEFIKNNSLALVAIIISLINIVISIINSCRSKKQAKVSNDLAKEAMQNSKDVAYALSSVEYEMSKKMQYQLNQVKSILDHIKDLENNTQINEPLKLEEDIKLLSLLPLMPEYRDLIEEIEKKIDDSNDRRSFYKNMFILTHNLGQLSREQVKTLVKEIDSVFSNQGIQNIVKPKGVGFVHYKLRNFGGRFVPKKTGDNEYVVIGEMYSEKHAIDAFKQFIDQLVTKHDNDDPNVLLYYGVMDGDGNRVVVNRALSLGADPGITVEKIIERYQSEYEEFQRFITNGNKSYDENSDFRFDNYKNDLN